MLLVSLYNTLSISGGSRSCGSWSRGSWPRENWSCGNWFRGSWFYKFLRLRWTSCARTYLWLYSWCVYCKSEYIPTVTNFASILANCFYFLRKITALWPSILNFWGRFVKFCQRSSGQTIKKRLCGRGLRRMLLKILCSAHILSAAWKLPSTPPRYLS